MQRRVLCLVVRFFVVRIVDMSASWPLGKGIAEENFSSEIDGLGVHEFVHAERRQFAAITRAFHAAKGKAGIGSDQRVDEGLSRLQLVAEAFNLDSVIRPDAAAKAEAG